MSPPTIYQFIIYPLYAERVSGPVPTDTDPHVNEDNVMPHVLRGMIIALMPMNMDPFQGGPFHHI